MNRTPMKPRTTPMKRKATKPKRRKAECSRRGCRRVGPHIPDPFTGDQLCMYHADERTAWPRFSWFIRQRDNRCTAGGVLHGPCQGPLQAAHIIGRDAKPTKFDPRNVHALCKAHHVMVDSAAGHEAFKFMWANWLLTEDDYREIHELAADIGSVKRREIVTAALATYPPKPDSGEAA
jgi:hypothetical protein